VIDLVSSADQRPHAFRVSYAANAELSLPAGGNDIALTAIPEPSAAAGAILLATMAGVLSRRRGRRL
jgi:hypothetical protein